MVSIEELTESMTFGSRRECKHPQCTTVLSIYNRCDWCSAHERAHPPAHFGSFIHPTHRGRTRRSQ